MTLHDIRKNTVTYNKKKNYLKVLHYFAIKFKEKVLSLQNFVIKNTLGYYFNFSCAANYVTAHIANQHYPAKALTF